MIAFGENGRVSIICSLGTPRADGSVDFLVENGGWSGTYFPERGEIEFNSPSGHQCHKVEKIWEGQPVGRGYNEWIANIEASLV